MPSTPIQDIDFTKIQFGKVLNKDNKQSVDITNEKGEKLFVQLTKDFQDPLPCKYVLDRPRDENPDRRGQAIVLSDPTVLKQLQTLDDTIVDYAFTHQKEFFKREGLSREVIADRYEKIVKRRPGEDEEYMKFKIKVGKSLYPTKLHKMVGDRLFKDKGKVSDLEIGGVCMSPVLSAYGLYFIGGGGFGISFQAEECVYTPGEISSKLGNLHTKRPFTVVQEDEENDDEEPPSKKVELLEEF